MEHWNIRIFGKVQGVFFRASTQERARALGLRGFVRNEPDGSVYIEAEGDAEALQQLADWCKQGPERARVERVETETGKQRAFDDFTIDRG
jgi:acylphosphatase